MSISASVGLSLFCFAVLSILLLRPQTRSSGLPIIYQLLALVIFLPGAWAYADGSYAYHDPRIIQDGIELFACSSLAYLAGVCAKDFLWPIRTNQDALFRLDIGDHSIYLFGFGLFCWMVLMPLLGGLPSMGALLSGLGQLSVVGILFGLLQIRNENNSIKTLGWILVLVSLPALTVTFQGFLGFGAFAIAMILVFRLAILRRWLTPLILLPAIVYLAMSLFVTYMRDRGEIRSLVWEGAIVSDRVSQIGNTLADFEWFDSEEPRHRMELDRRLNQSWQVGLLRQRLESNQIDHTSGDLIVGAVVAFIPRVLWPDKPVTGGGGDLVGRLLGIKFADGTSVGSTQVFDFFAEFGWAGLMGGFFLFGLVIRFIDGKAITWLWTGDWRKFLLWFMPGMALLQPGGNLTELAGALAGNWIAAWIAVRVIFAPAPTSNRVSNPGHGIA